ncbi:MAG TPA: peptidylprolyl isomerase [Rubricoccaceae bacterium]|jgi:peptidyl-prolyl cis-trans isomerase B (cyclophilin B)
MPRLSLAALLAVILALAPPADAQRRARRTARSARPAAAQVPAPAPAPVATNVYEITTPKGRLVVRLFDETPLHRDNFRARAAAGLFDSTLFHRVIPTFMAQGGDPNTRDDDPSNDGLDSPGATIPAEIGRPHVRGALAAARQGDEVNPLRASSPSQFFLVQGRPFGPRELPQVEPMVRQGTGNPSFTFAPDLAARYATEGGAPYLDGQYTVFGEIIEGLDVLDAIAAVPTRGPDRPTEDIWMVVRPLAPDYAPAAAP